MARLLGKSYLDVADHFESYALRWTYDETAMLKRHLLLQAKELQNAKEPEPRVQHGT